MDAQTFASVYSTIHSGNLELPKKLSEDELKALVVELEQRAIKAEKKLEALELVASYSKDVIEFWPSMTMRTIRVMIPKMQGLKEALELLNK